MRVAVIGSGASGLTAIKTCKEGNLDVVCYEQSDSIGGLWKYRENNEEGLASVAKSTTLNTSKELTSYSDFPPPKEFSNYMHNSMMFRYLEMYAKEFDLFPHIKFNHRVENVVQADDYDSTGRWKVTSINLKTEQKEEEMVDAVLICVGHHVFPYVPSFPGQDKFLGSITHTHSYKSTKGYQDKKIAVIGIGNSGVDTAVETSSVATKVYLSSRAGAWVLRRVGENGMPMDIKMLTRFKNILFNLMPLNVSNWYMEKRLNRAFHHETYQLKPKHRFFSQQFTVSDALPNRILSGTITVKGNIKRFEERGIVFEGDSQVTELDKVILATGYEIKFPFLDKQIIDTPDNQVELYRYVYPPNMKHPTLAIIGMVQGTGGLFPIFELQSRWFVQVLKKNVSLPSQSQMKKDIRWRLKTLGNRYYVSKRHTVQVDYIDYLDEIASVIGVKPNFIKILITDPKLFLALMTGPSLPYQYRLQGPHAWSKARETILDYRNRMYFPLQTRYRKPPNDETYLVFIYFMFMMVLVAPFLSVVIFT